jgi:hypothetical protein
LGLILLPLKTKATTMGWPTGAEPKSTSNSTDWSTKESGARLKPKAMWLARMVLPERNSTATKEVYVWKDEIPRARVKR